jgi:hypothetical protein
VAWNDIAVTKSEVVDCVAPAGQPVKLPEVEKQIVLAPANTISGSWTTIWAQLFDTVFEPSVAVKATVYIPGDSNT